MTMLTCILAMSVVSKADDLMPGSPAPKLDVKKWYKGKPVNSLDPKQTYVVEFWATWCGPCRASMPHLTELAKQYPKVNFMGISVFEEDDGKNIKTFVKEFDQQMGYTVGYSGNTTGMAATWLRASKQSTIPVAFIVQNNIVQFIGHPAGLPYALKQIQEKTWSIETAKKQYALLMAKSEDHQEARKRLGDAQDLIAEAKYDEALKILSEVEPKFPSHQGEVWTWRWIIEMKKDLPAWQKHSEQLIQAYDPKEMEAMRFFILVQGSPQGNASEGVRLLNLIVPKAADDDYGIHLTSAMFYDSINKPDEAVKCMDRSLAAFKRNKDNSGNKEILDSLEKRRAAYAAKVKLL